MAPDAHKMDRSEVTAFFKKLKASKDAGDNSDMTLICQCCKFTVHKAIVNTHTNFFRAACDGGFKEAETNTVDCDDDLDAFARMVAYMYTLKYDEAYNGVKGKEEESGESTSTAPQGGDVSFDKLKGYSSMRTYVTADKYGIRPLQDMAKDAFEIWMEKNWSQEDCLDVALEAFKTTSPDDTGLRCIVGTVVGLHPELLQNSRWMNAIKQDGEMAWAVVCCRNTCGRREQHDLEQKILELGQEIAQLRTGHSQKTRRWQNSYHSSR